MVGRYRSSHLREQWVAGRYRSSHLSFCGPAADVDYETTVVLGAATTFTAP